MFEALVFSRGLCADFFVSQWQPQVPFLGDFSSSWKSPKRKEPLRLEMNATSCSVGMFWVQDGARDIFFADILVDQWSATTCFW